MADQEIEMQAEDPLLTDDDKRRPYFTKERIACIKEWLTCIRGCLDACGFLLLMIVAAFVVTAIFVSFAVMLSV